MKERDDKRVLGAIRWVDAVTNAAISLPLVVRSTTLRFARNLSGLTIITEASGLEAYTRTFNLDDLPESDEVTPLSLTREGEVHDPSGTYLPARFAVRLPLDPSPALLPPDNHRPADSLFSPIDIPLLPSPAARLVPGCAEVRVSIQDTEGNPIPNALARVVSEADDTLLGCGLADARGETLVAIPGLKHFAPGATEDEVVSVKTEARLEIVHPPPNQSVVDWTALREAPVASGDTDPTPLQLTPGSLISRRYPFGT